MVRQRCEHEVLASQAAPAKAVDLTGMEVVLGDPADEVLGERGTVGVVGEPPLFIDRVANGASFRSLADPPNLRDYLTMAGSTPTSINL